MALAILFVPVLYFFGFGGLVAPCCFAIFEIVMGRGDATSLSLEAFYVAVYNGLFFAGALGSFWISALANKPTGRLVIQSLFLLALFSCSFLRVIVEAGGSVNAESSGTYNFWEACVRLSQTYHKYLP